MTFVCLDCMQGVYCEATVIFIRFNWLECLYKNGNFSTWDLILNYNYMGPMHVYFQNYFIQV